uniref:non-specific serine/threonine protein kinase n=1 Tax=Hyaloperonospora arabidopsidis (strain Emoy2) TaxID=559515 RepID=M4B8G8_HYAAE
MELLSTKEKDQSFREAQLLAKLKHPNVVEYKANFEADNVLHIVMTYCDGGDLADTIKQQKKIREALVGSDCSHKHVADPRGYFPITQVLDWFVQMAMAIKYLHDQRILHRDLKTSNVFLTTENVVKVGDFGIAKTLDSTLDQAQTMVGTPYYMSPEVCESKPYSYASDVWSLGCILYEMLALRHAFDAPNILTLILKIVQQDCAPVPPCYDRQVSDLVHKLLDKDPEKRPSMEEIFAMPYIRHHMQGLVTSSGSLKVKMMKSIPQSPQHGSNGQCQLRPRNPSPRRSSGEKRRLRPAASTGSFQAAVVAPMQWVPIESRTKNADKLKERNEFGLLDSRTSEPLQLNFRLPERSSTPEPLAFVTEDKQFSSMQDEHERSSHDEAVDNGALDVKPRAARVRSRLQRTPEDNLLVAWTSGKSDEKSRVSSGACPSIIESVDAYANDSEFRVRTKELMDPNFQCEYADEGVDSLQIYCSSKANRVTEPNVRVKRQSEDLQHSGVGDRSTQTTPGIRGFDRAPESSTLSSDSVESESTGTPSLSESSMMRAMELDADSDNSDVSSGTSSSEYEVEENYYSDGSSFDRSGTQYSDDDFETPDAEVIEYADEEFVSEGDDDDNEHSRFSSRGEADKELASAPKGSQNPTAGYGSAVDDSSRFALAPKLEGPTEVQRVM